MSSSRREAVGLESAGRGEGGGVADDGVGVRRCDTEREKLRREAFARAAGGEEGGDLIRSEGAAIDGVFIQQTRVVPIGAAAQIRAGMHDARTHQAGAHQHAIDIEVGLPVGVHHHQVRPALDRTVKDQRRGNVEPGVLDHRDAVGADGKARTRMASAIATVPMGRKDRVTLPGADAGLETDRLRDGSPALGGIDP